MDQRFPRAEKLKRRTLIKALFSRGAAKTVYPLRLIYLPIEEPVHKMGVSVPKRKFKKAVDRNRIKRQIREAYRLNKEEMTPFSSHYALLFIYLSKEKMDFVAIQSAMQDLLRQLTKL